jgi:hypothetical protein
VEINGAEVPANGYSSYKLAITLRDPQGKIVTDMQPDLQTTLDNQAMIVLNPVQAEDRWVTWIAAKLPGSHQLAVSADGQPIKTVDLDFVAPPLPETTPSWWQTVWQGQMVIIIICLGFFIAAIAVIAWPSQPPTHTKITIDPTTRELATNYIKQLHQQGITDQVIRARFIAAGWSEEHVRELGI